MAVSRYGCYGRYGPYGCYGRYGHFAMAAMAAVAVMARKCPLWPFGHYYFAQPGDSQALGVSTKGCF